MSCPWSKRLAAHGGDAPSRTSLTVAVGRNWQAASARICPTNSPSGPSGLSSLGEDLAHDGDPGGLVEVGELLAGHRPGRSPGRALRDVGVARGSGRFGIRCQAARVRLVVVATSAAARLVVCATTPSVVRWHAVVRPRRRQTDDRRRRAVRASSSWPRYAARPVPDRSTGGEGCPSCVEAPLPFMMPITALSSTTLKWSCTVAVVDHRRDPRRGTPPATGWPRRSSPRCWRTCCRRRRGRPAAWRRWRVERLAEPVEPLHEAVGLVAGVELAALPLADHEVDVAGASVAQNASSSASRSAVGPRARRRSAGVGHRCPIQRRAKSRKASFSCGAATVTRTPSSP